MRRQLWKPPIECLLPQGDLRPYLMSLPSEASDESRLKRILAAAVELGADEAKIIDARKVVVDRRVRLKCLVPICASYGRNLMCPPNTMSVDDFSSALESYRRALILQIEADHDSLDKLETPLTQKTCDELDDSTQSRVWQLKLHRLVNQLESIAFKEGFHLAAGLAGGDCALCSECVAHQTSEYCRHPFEARPSMEAMGIDVLRTCDNVGLPLSLSSERRVRWTGLVLLD